MSVKVFHFADTHIDSATHGKRDTNCGLPFRCMDVLAAIDQMIDRAIAEKADIVLFAGDAYRDAVPVPTYQREWGKRMKRLSDAKIPVLLITGNHDRSPTRRSASALQEYDTLSVPYIHLAANIQLWRPQELDGCPLQVITVCWPNKSAYIATYDLSGLSAEQILFQMEEEIVHQIETFIEQADPEYPLILLAHTSVAGSLYPSAQPAVLGQDISLPLPFMNDPRFAYVALGHIHKFQDLNAGFQPPIVYAGSIERVDYGEIRDSKGFIMADVAIGHTAYTFCKDSGRRWFSREVTVEETDDIAQKTLDALPDKSEMPDAMVRLIIHYPENCRDRINDRELHKATENALEFQLICRPIHAARIRILSDQQTIAALSAIELLQKYCEMTTVSADESAALIALAYPFIENQELRGTDEENDK